MIPRKVAIAVGFAAVLVAGDLATVRMGSRTMVGAPNLRAPLPATLEPNEQRIAVGPPAAVLSVEVGNPKLPPNYAGLSCAIPVKCLEYAQNIDRQWRDLERCLLVTIEDKPSRLPSLRKGTHRGEGIGKVLTCPSRASPLVESWSRGGL